MTPGFNCNNGTCRPVRQTYGCSGGNCPAPRPSGGGTSVFQQGCVGPNCPTPAPVRGGGCVGPNCPTPPQPANNGVQGAVANGSGCVNCDCGGVQGQMQARGTNPFGGCRGAQGQMQKPGGDGSADVDGEGGSNIQNNNGTEGSEGKSADVDISKYRQGYSSVLDNWNGGCEGGGCGGNSKVWGGANTKGGFTQGANGELYDLDLNQDTGHLITTPDGRTYRPPSPEALERMRQTGEPAQWEEVGGNGDNKGGGIFEKGPDGGGTIYEKGPDGTDKEQKGPVDKGEEKFKELVNKSEFSNAKKFLEEKGDKFESADLASMADKLKSEGKGVSELIQGIMQKYGVTEVTAKELAKLFGLFDKS